MKIIGWDIGGAHIKASFFDFKKSKIKTRQIFFPIWRNYKKFIKTIALLEKKFPKCDYHAVTTTAEMSDIFKNRKTGVKKIINLFTQSVSQKKIFFYGKKKFLRKKIALKKTHLIASMNWHASANFISKIFSDCILLDIGSTTTDIIPIKNKKINLKSFTDFYRLNNSSLIYTGVLRTPITSITNSINFKKRKYKLMNENFATIGDVYRILGEIPKKVDLNETSDMKSKKKRASARRLSRLLGLDYKHLKFKDCKQAALNVKQKHIKLIRKCLLKVEKKNFEKKVSIIGLGSGEFLIKDILKKRRNYKPFYKTIKKYLANKSGLNCEPSISLIFLLYNSLTRTTFKF